MLVPPLYNSNQSSYCPSDGSITAVVFWAMISLIVTRKSGNEASLVAPGVG